MHRDIWPENDDFGSFTAAPEDELMLLREIFTTNLNPGKCFTNDNSQRLNYMIAYHAKKTF